MNEPTTAPVQSSQDAYLLSLAKQYPHLAGGNPELKAFVEVKQQAIAADAKAKVTGNVEPPAEAATPAIPPAQSPPATPVVEPPELEEPEIEGVFFKEKKAKPIKFEGQEDIQAYVQKKYQVEKPEDWGKFLANVEQWRNQSQKAEEVQEQFENTVESLNKLPYEIQIAMLAYSKGEDYRNAFNKSVTNIDFSKDIDAHPKSEIVKYFYPNDFTEEDLEDFDDNPQVKAAYNMAKTTFYPKAQKAIQEQRADLERESEAIRKRLNDSTKSSVEFLEQTFPGVDKNEVKKIEQILVSGDDVKLLGLFKNRDGSVKKEAAKMLSMALFGEDQMKSLLKMLDEQGKAVYGVAKAQPKTPAESTKPAGQQPNQEAANVLGSFVKKKTY